MNTELAGDARHTPSPEFLRLARSDRAELALVIRGGAQPDIAALAGWEYRGMNLGTGPRLLGIRKFIKGFCRPAAGEAFGYNLRARQNAPEDVWLPQPGGGERPFGFYRIAQVVPGSRDTRYPNALFLDYGRGGNGRFAVTGLIRDYLVRVAPGSDELLLGKAFLAVGPLRLPVGYFILERDAETADCSDHELPDN